MEYMYLIVGALPVSALLSFILLYAFPNNSLKWDFYRTIFEIKYKYVTFFLPIIFTYILFSEGIGDFSSKFIHIGICGENNSENFSFYLFFENGHCKSKYFLYFSLFSFSASSILFSCFCPNLIKFHKTVDIASDYYLKKPYSYTYYDAIKDISEPELFIISETILGTTNNNDPTSRHYTSHEENILKQSGLSGPTRSRGGHTTSANSSHIFYSIQNEQRFIRELYSIINEKKKFSRFIILNFLTFSLCLFIINSIFYLSKIIILLSIS